jgi:flavodoxin
MLYHRAGSILLYDPARYARLEARRQKARKSDRSHTSMKTLIVYDSFFGNTEQVAQAIGKALGAQADVNVLRVGDVKPEHLTGLDLLIVGSPTRAFSPSPAIKEFLGHIPKQSLRGVTTAAFDTRVALSDVNSRVLPVFVRLFGYAAQPIADQLVRKGGTPRLPPEGFFVQGTEGPLKAGELERAAAWAKQITPMRQ